MYIISILYNIINCHARVFKEKTQNASRPSEHPPVVGGKNKQTQNAREAWDTTQFLEFKEKIVTLYL